MSRFSALLPILLRLGLGLFFLVSGVLKVRDLEAFTEDIFNYQILFPPYDAYAAYFVAWLEIIVGGVFAVGFWGRRGALTIISGLLVVFIIALSMAAAQGLNINCGCFGKSDEPTNFPLHITFNLTLLAVCGYLFWQEFRPGRNHLFGQNRLVLPD